MHWFSQMINLFKDLKQSAKRRVLYKYRQYSVQHSIKYEELMPRFPHLFETIFGELDNKSMIKCRKVSRRFQEFIDESNNPTFQQVVGRTNMFFEKAQRPKWRHLQYLSFYKVVRPILIERSIKMEGLGKKSDFIIPSYWTVCISFQFPSVPGSYFGLCWARCGAPTREGPRAQKVRSGGAGLKTIIWPAGQAGMAGRPPTPYFIYIYNIICKILYFSYWMAY